jgi:hypothetical protein
MSWTSIFFCWQALNRHIETILPPLINAINEGSEDSDAIRGMRMLWLSVSFAQDQATMSSLPANLYPITNVAMHVAPNRIGGRDCAVCRQRGWRTDPDHRAP